MHEWIGFKADSPNASQSSFNQRRARATKRVEDDMLNPQVKSREVVAHQVRWIREDKTVPIVKCAVLRV